MSASLARAGTLRHVLSSILALGATGCASGPQIPPHCEQPHLGCYGPAASTELRVLPDATALHPSSDGYLDHGACERLCTAPPNGSPRDLESCHLATVAIEPAAAATTTPVDAAAPASEPGRTVVACNYWVHRECSYTCFVHPRGRLPAALRASVPARPGASPGEYLADGAWLESAAVAAFDTLASELRAHGAPPRLLRRARQAARDERRHARTMTALARRYGASVHAPPRAPATARSLEAIALENAEEGCVRESFGALLALEQARTAGDPVVRAAMARIARDELRHASLAWAVDAWIRPRLSASVARRVERAMHRAGAELARAVAAERPSRDATWLLGVPDAERGAALASALHDRLQRAATLAA